MDINEKLKFIDKFARSLTEYETCENERYIHHLFSHRIQAECQEIEISKLDGDSSQLHPEWATAKVARDGKDVGKKAFYNKKEPVLKGNNSAAGHIDFAIGGYESPKIAIEFKVMNGINDTELKELQFDFLKLLDGRSPFDYGYSIVFVVKDVEETVLLEKAKEALNDAKNQLEPLGWDSSNQRQFTSYLIFKPIGKKQREVATIPEDK